MNIPTITFSKENITYLTPSWEHLNELTFDISRQILDLNQSFDRIVTLAKGGWPMTRSLVDFLGVEKVASIGVKFYGGINHRLSKPEIYQDLPVEVKGEKVLLFDDVADSGESLKFVIDYLQKNQVKEITTATLFYKDQSIIKPDFYGFKTDAWIIFPFETAESVEMLSRKWFQVGLSMSKIKDRFSQLHLQPEWVDYYLERQTNHD